MGCLYKHSKIDRRKAKSHQKLDHQVKSHFSQKK